MIGRALRSLRGDRRGATVIEFAIVVPVMLTLIMGLAELAYQEYMQSVLVGAIQKAGRDSAIQNSQTTQIDASVIGQLTQLRTGWTSDCSGSPPTTAPTYCSTRKSYSTFINDAPEPFVDTAGTGAYVASKDCFTDINGNGVWDADPGASGQGGANDVAVYSISITYPRLFPVFGLIGLSQAATLSSQTILKNQPWLTQVSNTPTQVCPH